MGASGEGSSLRLRAYRKVLQWTLGSGTRWRPTPEGFGAKGEASAPASGPSSAGQGAGRCIWIHAASAGELESLWSVAEELARQGHRLILTGFSRSAIPSIERLRLGIVEGSGAAAILEAGYSPMEGSWRSKLAHWRPDVFVTAKYEAWPELWATLGELDIPLVIQGARARSSLTWAARICALLGARVPRMFFLLTDHADADALSERFPEARSKVCGDPRWDRVAARLERGNPRASEILDALAGLPRPWGVLGSAWDSDLEAWDRALDCVKGTLFVVPHHVDGATVSRMEALIDRFRPGARIRTAGTAVEALKAHASDGAAPRPRTVVVDEMGFLLEIYPKADWAFVGGGFGAGVHSTLEPALSGIPVGCGPARADRFPEVALLTRRGQLEVLADSEALAAWASRVESATPTSLGDEWRIQARQELGATHRVVAAIVAVGGRAGAC